MVASNAKAILALDQNSDEGHFLNGLTFRAERNIPKAMQHFERCLELNDKRHDAAIELANMYSRIRRNGDAAALIEKYTPLLQGSPRYLDLAGTICVEIGMADKAWPLYQRANLLQPSTPLLMNNLANCAVYVGRLDEAKDLFQQLIDANPENRQNYFHYSRLNKFKDEAEIQPMLDQTTDFIFDENRNTPLYFAIGKAYEDIGDWKKSQEYYAKANKVVADIINYDPAGDFALIDYITENCTEEWIGSGTNKKSDLPPKTPLFIAGLPRTGTTLVERILCSHSKISSLGETLFVQKCAADLAGPGENIFAAAAYGRFMENSEQLPQKYFDSVSYRVGSEPIFIEKLPLNFLFLGPLAKAWPDAKFVVLKRGAMDTAFSLYKQVFTWAYKFSYDLDHIGQYYLAYDKLMKHWKSVLGDRLIEVDYETLAQNPDAEIPNLIKKIGVEFEQGCLDFHLNESASTTASTVQIRSKISTGSIGKWRHYEEHLSGLVDYFDKHGIPVD